MSRHDDPDYWPPTATEIALQQKQAELRAKAEEYQRHRAMVSVKKVEDVLANSPELMKVAIQLASDGRYGELKSMAEVLQKHPPATIPGGVSGGVPPAVHVGVDMAKSQSRARRPQYTLAQKLCMRMGWDGLDDGNAKLHIVHDEGKVFVFGVRKGEAFTLQDEADIFPSDQIVTQLRMVCGD